jgi:hypothetical protein
VVNVRQFTDGDLIQLSIGSTLSNFSQGACTIAAIVRNADAGNFRPIVSFNSGSQRRSFWKNGSNNLMMESGGFSSDTTLTMTIANNWIIPVYTKASGIATPRGHRHIYDTTTWNHADGGTQLNDDAETLVNILLGRSSSSGISWSGKIALIGVWKSVIGNDAAIEALNLHLNLQNWIDANPDGLWALNQESTSNPVLDLIGDADQTSITGTTVVDDTDLEFDFGGNVDPILVGTGSLADRIMEGLISQGFTTGSLSDRERARLLAKLVLVEPQPLTIQDLYDLADEPNRMVGQTLFGAPLP